VLVVVGVEERGEFFWRFGFEEDAAGEADVAKSVEGGRGFAFGGFGAGGEEGVLPVGVDLSF